MTLATLQRVTNKADQYITDVLSGKALASEWVTLQIRNHADDLVSGHKRGLSFNAKRGLHVIRFIEQFIKGTVDKYDGQPYILEPWEAALLFILYGWERNGQRRFKVAYCEIARGNKKSTLASALCLYDLLSTPGANVYSASSGKDTAKIVFDTAAAMVHKSDTLRKMVKSFRDNLHIREKGSKFEPCSAEAKTIFKASRPSFIVLDELHLHPNKDVWTAFWTALNKRDDSMLFAITNSGYDRHSVCWEQRDYSIKVLQRVIPDDTWFSWICGLSEDDNWEDERTWIKANLSLGRAVDIEGLRRVALKAKEDPSSLNEFLRFYMCIWTESNVVWMPMDKWELCNESLVTEVLKGRQCFAGMDLSTTTDISAVVLLFPPYGEDKKWRVLPFFFLPKDNITKRVKRDRVPYDVWARQGLFTLTDGPVIDYDVIRAKVNELAKDYRIVEVAYDPYNASQIVSQLISDGLTLVEFRQGDVSMTAPLKRLMELVLNKELSHGGNPVLRWMAANTVVKIGATGLMKPDKEKSREKIDGICAMLDALGRAMRVPIQQKVTFLPFVI
jgi:phage terminase large subunit-like protein